MAVKKKPSLEAKARLVRMKIRRLALPGPRPLAFTLRRDSGKALIARHPGMGFGRPWRCFIFDASDEPVGDYGPAPFCESEFEGLIRTALEFGADLDSVKDPPS